MSRVDLDARKEAERDTHVTPKQTRRLRSAFVKFVAFSIEGKRRVRYRRGVQSCSNCMNRGDSSRAGPLDGVHVRFWGRSRRDPSLR